MVTRSLREELCSLAKTASRILLTEPKQLEEDFKHEIMELESLGFEEAKRTRKYATFQSEEFGEVTKRIIHGNKIEPIYGADLAIEFRGRKTIFIQVKLARGGRFKIPRYQLLTLVGVCKRLCSCTCCPVSPDFPPYRGAAFYELQSNKKVYLRPCDVNFILGNRQSMAEWEAKGIPQEDFEEGVRTCTIGCGDLPQKEKELLFSEYATITNRVVFLLETTV